MNAKFVFQFLKYFCELNSKHLTKVHLLHVILFFWINAYSQESEVRVPVLTGHVTPTSEKQKNEMLIGQQSLESEMFQKLLLLNEDILKNIEINKLDKSYSLIYQSKFNTICSSCWSNSQLDLIQLRTFCDSNSPQCLVLLEFMEEYLLNLQNQ